MVMTVMVDNNNKWCYLRWDVSVVKDDSPLPIHGLSYEGGVMPTSYGWGHCQHYLLLLEQVVLAYYAAFQSIQVIQLHYSMIGLVDYYPSELNVNNNSNICHQQCSKTTILLSVRMSMIVS